MSLYQEIKLSEFTDISVGHAEDDNAKTGVSVIYFKNGARVGTDISGGGPASHEIALTSPLTADNPINAIVLSGGSAYGLNTTHGVMEELENHNIGYDTGYAKVPLVLGASIYDLGYGRSDIRPNSSLGEIATKKALNGSDDSSGNAGVGKGATVGKIMGMHRATKAGFGSYFIKYGELVVGAMVVTNALGDIYDEEGKMIAGLLNDTRDTFMNSEDVFMEFMKPRDLFTGNTTLGVVVTNAKFSKAELTKIANMTRNAYARSINPVGTMADGDIIFAASTNDLVVDINLVGILASKVMQKAIVRSIETSKISDEEYLSNIGDKYEKI